MIIMKPEFCSIFLFFLHFFLSVPVVLTWWGRAEAGARRHLSGGGVVIKNWWYGLDIDIWWQWFIMIYQIYHDFYRIYHDVPVAILIYGIKGKQIRKCWGILKPEIRHAPFLDKPESPEWLKRCRFPNFGSSSWNFNINIIAISSWAIYHELVAPSHHHPITIPAQSLRRRGYWPHLGLFPHCWPLWPPSPSPTSWALSWIWWGDCWGDCCGIIWDEIASIHGISTRGFTEIWVKHPILKHPSLSKIPIILIYFHQGFNSLADTLTPA